MTVENLLIIGNGFDLKCDLKSSYTNFFDSYNSKKNNLINNFYKDVDQLKTNSITNVTRPQDLYVYSYYIDNLRKKSSELISDPSICFWNIVFGNQNTKYKDWNNIEKKIENIVCNSINSDMTIEKIMYYYNQLKTENRVTYPHIKLDINKQGSYVLALYLLIIETEIEDIYLYLLDELNIFEKQFCSYLDHEVKSNATYQSNIKYLLEDINKSKSNVINFNYTKIENSPNINLESNVHGSLDKGSIIFGIDLSNLSPEKGNFYFTKTYRKMHAFENVSIDNFKKQSVLDRSIESISFYGHSLNESDYSYFQSIFDFYEIYNSKISLIFYYSIYDSNQKKEIKKGYTNAVINLLNTYGKTMANEFHGKNFLHKLLLENRVILKKV